MIHVEYYPKIIPVKFGEILASSLGDDVVKSKLVTDDGNDNIL